MKKYIITVCFSLLALGCGTDTGNPGLQEKKKQAILDPGPHNTFAKLFSGNICEKIKSCNPEVDFNECNAQMMELGNLEVSLGIEEGTFQNFNEIVEAEENGDMGVNSKNANTCVADILEINCDDHVINDVYDENLDNPFIGVHMMVPESCSQVYSINGDR